MDPITMAALFGLNFSMGLFDRYNKKKQVKNANRVAMHNARVKQLMLSQKTIASAKSNSEALLQRSKQGVMAQGLLITNLGSAGFKGKTAKRLLSQAQESIDYTNAISDVNLDNIASTLAINSSNIETQRQQNAYFREKQIPSIFEVGLKSGIKSTQQGLSI